MIRAGPTRGGYEIMNTRPLTPVSDSPDDFSALTPMPLLCGSLDSSLPPDVFFQADDYRRSWRTLQLLADLFWRRWMKECGCNLSATSRLVTSCSFAINSKRGAWPKAILEETLPTETERWDEYERLQLSTYVMYESYAYWKLAIWATDSRFGRWRCYCLLWSCWFTLDCLN